MARAPRPRPRPRGETPPPVTSPAGQSDLFAAAQPPARRVLTYLDIAALGLGMVSISSLHAGAGPDGYLYHVTTRDGMDTIHARGTVVFSRRAPLVLTERPGVAAWLADMVEHDAPGPDGPPDSAPGERPVIFRVRRFMIDDLLENDPDRTRRYGVPFYLLTGIARPEHEGGA
ncbi:hypothetical protein [Komagataeibacter sp. FNDCR2]|uniref:hypothetical protein n=1 Tax=Komagataeibacter sp. FNDCR2 TaxID=2878682 RepID=UPI001E3A7612|nr:hypothetical protein [Komagataeibacter sp. FNDCR2]MCE2575756.1 hypothetical protein [Komagataeibacter sp. FNDCR2]